MQTRSDIADENGVSFVIVRHWNYPVSFYYAKFNIKQRILVTNSSFDWR